ncbi:MAG: N-acetylneuraminate synthase family protein [bacterium]|nr:N-acetylneuraminate synthase family protein [bacterium]
MENKIKNIFQSQIENKKSAVFVIAEMAWSHDGSVEKAKKIIKGAADAKADAISLHFTSLKDYMVRNYGCSAGQTMSAGREDENIYKYHEGINLKNSDWQELVGYAKSFGLEVCVMPNDFESFKFAQTINADAYVISSACFLEDDFVRNIARAKKPVILRIGGATLGEIEKVVNIIRKEENNEIILLYGIQLYPTKIEDTHLSLIPSLRKIFDLPVGLADHINATSELAMVVPLTVLSMGVKVIEKHITHDRSLKGEDIEAALNPDEFKKFVEYIQEAEKAMGKPYFRDLSEAELKYRNVSRKKTVALKQINKGEEITRDNITFKRADDGVSPVEAQYLIGRKANRDIKEEEPILWEKIN